MSDSDTTLTFTSDTNLPVLSGSDQFTILIDDEYLIVTAVVALVATVTRGAEGSTPAAHGDGASVFCPLTAGPVSTYVQLNEVNVGDIILSGTVSVGGSIEKLTDSLDIVSIGNITLQSQGAGSLTVVNNNGSILLTTGSPFHELLLETTGNLSWPGGKVTFTNLPSSDPGIPGQLYHTSGTLKVSL